MPFFMFPYKYGKKILFYCASERKQVLFLTLEGRGGILFCTNCGNWQNEKALPPHIVSQTQFKH